MAIADRSGLPVAVYVTSASPHEVTLVERTLDAKFTVDYPVRLIGDKAYDSNDLDTWLKEQYHLQMIAPNLCSRKVKTQDGRVLRRYKRRWKIERLFAWLQNSRRIQTRWERKLQNYTGFIHLACLIILLGYILKKRKPHKPNVGLGCTITYHARCFLGCYVARADWRLLSRTKAKIAPRIPNAEKRAIRRKVVVSVSLFEKTGSGTNWPFFT